MLEARRGFRDDRVIGACLAVVHWAQRLRGRLPKSIDIVKADGTTGYNEDTQKLFTLLSKQGIRL